MTLASNNWRHSDAVLSILVYASSYQKYPWKFQIDALRDCKNRTPTVITLPSLWLLHIRRFCGITPHVSGHECRQKKVSFWEVLCCQKFGCYIQFTFLTELKSHDNQKSSSIRQEGSPRWALILCMSCLQNVITASSNVSYANAWRPSNPMSPPHVGIRCARAVAIRIHRSRKSAPYARRQWRLSSIWTRPSLLPTEFYVASRSRVPFARITIALGLVIIRIYKLTSSCITVWIYRKVERSERQGGIRWNEIPWTKCHQ